MSVDLTSIAFDRNANLFLTQNLSDCNNEIGENKALKSACDKISQSYFYFCLLMLTIFTKRFLLQMDSGPCQTPYVAFFVYDNSFYRGIHLRCLTWC